MKIYNLPTPSFLIDMNVLEKNILHMQKSCDENNIELHPMIKTNKSSAISEMLIKAGAKGVLAGTIDEVEKLTKLNPRVITYAYPITNYENIRRIANLAKNQRIILSVDGVENAEILNTALENLKQTLEVLIIIDCGLHRFGVLPEKAGAFAKKLQAYKNLKLIGISSHPGHVYGAKGNADIIHYVQDEKSALHQAYSLIKEAGFNLEIIATGSTPTVFETMKDNIINVVRPGNYVFYDNIQISLGVAKEADCALTILATIVSKPNDKLMIMDAGTKCFGLDKGAHGIALINGYGKVLGHEELIVKDLSEEVGKIAIIGETNIHVGDKIRIIPNHSCSSANMTNYLIGHRKDDVTNIIDQDMRGGSVRKPPIIT